MILTLLLPKLPFGSLFADVFITALLVGNLAFVKYK
jgi:hypothetical protein